MISFALLVYVRVRFNFPNSSMDFLTMPYWCEGNVNQAQSCLIRNIKGVVCDTGESLLIFELPSVLLQTRASNAQH